MDKMLTLKEKRYIKDLLKDSREIDPVMWPDWGPMVSYALGGLLIVFVCLTTVSNLTALNIKFVLLPGVLAGMLLFSGGAWTQHMSKKIQERKMLAGLLKKLLP